MNAQIVEAMSAFHAQEGEAPTYTRCVEKGLIASICMTCGNLYRIRKASGANGGLSHGWCSNFCAEAGGEGTEGAGKPRVSI
jgi:hypothetical protein